MKVNSYWEKNKFNLPFAIGLLIWIIIFIILLFRDMQEGSYYSEVITFNLVLSLLVVGVPTCMFEIVFVYIVKVVKMKPKSSYDIGNINDYITLQELFRSGKYEYETIRSKEDISRAYEVGKKIVFTEIDSGQKILIWFGIIFSIAGFILACVLVIPFSFSNFPLDILALTFITANSIGTGVGAVFFVPGFLRSRRLPRSFFILAPEGVVYRRVWGGVMSYSWKELDLEVYSVTTTHSLGGFFKMDFPAPTEIHIILPNGSRLKFKPYEYDLDEFLSLEKFAKKLKEKMFYELVLKAKNLVLALVVMTFKHYFDAAKGEYETSSEFLPQKTNQKTFRKDFKREN